jgi:CheY-like chemotaxis protein
VNSPAKIPIVDDEPLDVDILGQEPEDLDYQTVSADKGEEALTKAAAEAPDLVLVDVMLPGMGGFTVCRRLKGKKG